MRAPLCTAAVSLAALTFAAAPAVAAAPSTTVTNAAAFVASQQQADGGFEAAGFPGFETPDAVLALAEAGQTGSTWSPDDALAAVEAVQNAGGLTGLDAIDDLAEAADITAGRAAKLIVLDVAPLGLDPADVDPSDDSSDAVDLVAVLDAGAQSDGSFGAAFTDTLYAALADVVLGRSVPTATVDFIEAAQQANGGWGFGGDPTATDVDPDTTGLAIEALVAGGVKGDDPAIAQALGMLAAAQAAMGAFASPFDDGNPNSTAIAMLGIAAAGYDPASSCWRDTTDPALAGTAYVDPTAYLEGQQADDGHIASPADSFGVNTSATSQSVHALTRTWLPVTADAARTCAVVPSSTTTTAATPASVAATDPTLPATGAGTGRTTGLGVGALAAGGLALLLAAAARRRVRS